MRFYLPMDTRLSVCSRTQPRVRCTVLVAVCLCFLFYGMVAGQVIPGAARTGLYDSLLKNKRLGIVANRASVIGDLNIVDIMVRKGYRVAAIFSPEHGFRETAEAGATVGNHTDPVTGLPVISLYGDKKKPLPADLAGLDAIVFDIQDVGVRFYTYISTLALVMESCAGSAIPVIVFDRPNPNGYYIDGPVLQQKFASFVGMHPVPVVYGMTIGEYALMVNSEGWLKNGVKCDLHIIPVGNYTHQTRVLLSSKPSPNLPNDVAVCLYPSLCFFEGTPVSVGRGTEFPFQVYGHPALGFGTFSFTPGSIPGVSVHPPQEGMRCRGEDLRGFFRENPDQTGRIHLSWLLRSYRKWRGREPFFNDYFNKLAGNELLKKQIVQGKSEKEIRQSWKADLDKFKQIRTKYLLYP